MAVATEVSEAELKREYQTARLWALGIPFAKAVATPLIRLGLEVSAKAHRNKPNQPLQPKLI